MIGENQQLVTVNHVSFKKQPIEIQDFRRITDHFRIIYGIYLNLLYKNQRMSTCQQLDLQTLGS